MGGQRHAPADLTPGKGPVPIVQEAGWAPGPVWIGAENLAPHRDSIPDLPARSESLYRLRYPALPIKHTTKTKEMVYAFSGIRTYNHGNQAATEIRLIQQGSGN